MSEDRKIGVMGPGGDRGAGGDAMSEGEKEQLLHALKLQIDQAVRLRSRYLAMRRAAHFDGRNRRAVKGRGGR